MNNDILEVDYKSHKIIGDIIPSHAIPKLLVLHGGGSANISRYSLLRELLGKQGYSSFGFDYIGHGKSTGGLKGSSLEERAEVTLQVIRNTGFIPESILGSSMGAYTAIQLLKSFEIKNLILFVPAIYSDASYKLPFGSRFKEEISKPESWLQSEAWDLLESFAGKLFIVSAENDDVIPPEVIENIFNRAVNTAVKRIYVVKGAPHGFTRFLNEHPKQLSNLVKAIIDFLRE